MKLTKAILFLYMMFIIIIMTACSNGNKSKDETENKLTPSGAIQKERSYENGMTDNEKSKMSVRKMDFGDLISFYDDEMGKNYESSLLKSKNFDQMKDASLFIVLGKNFNDTEIKELNNYLNSNSPQTMVLLLNNSEDIEDNTEMKNSYITKAEDLNNFITNNLLGWMYENYKIDSDKICITGYGKAGCFAAISIYEEKNVNNYLLVQPELHIQNKNLDIINKDKKYAGENKSLPSNVCVVRAGDDQMWMAYNSTTQWMDAATAHNYKGFRLKDIMIPGAGKNTIGFEALMQGICYFDGREYGDKERDCVFAAKAMSQKEKDSIKLGSLSKEHEFYKEVVGKHPDAKDYIKEITMYDEEINDNFLIHISLPSGYDPHKKYPLVLMTDGIWRLSDHPEIREMMKKGEVEDVILVSVGYPNDYDYMQIRERDLVKQPDLFLQFLIDNVMPYMRANYSIDATRTMLTGHSYGGYWGFYSLFHSDTIGENTFAYYYIGSPSFQCNTNLALVSNFEDWYAQRDKNLNCSVYMTVGSAESMFIDMYKPFLEQLKERNYGGFKFEYKIIQGYDHNTVFKPSIRNAMLKFYPVK